MPDLTGKIGIVTGGTQGVGEAIAREAAACGAAGIALVGRNADKADAVARTLGCEALFVPAELSDPQSCRSVVPATVAEFGRVDFLVNAAGATDRGGILDIDLATWDKLFAVNVRAPFILMQDAARVMVEQGTAGAIVNIITMTSHGGQPFLSGYSASKGALGTLTKNAANALKFRRIRVVGLNIGWTDTPNEHKVQVETMGQPEDWLARAEAEQPFGQLIKPVEIGKMVAFLISPDAGIMTGALIDYDQMVMGTYE